MDLLIVLFKFVNASVNGNNIENENMYVNSRIFDSIQDILKIGFYNSKNNYANLKCGEYKEGNLPHTGKAFMSNKKINELKFQALILVNSLINTSNQSQFITDENLKTLLRIQALGYAQLIVAKNKKYTTDLFNDYSKINQNISVSVFFQSYYLVAQLWDNYGCKSVNIVQKIDTLPMWKYYLNLMDDVWFSLSFWKNKSVLLDKKTYDAHIKGRESHRKAVKFFDAHSSSIELVMPDGTTETRYFKIHPAFISFSQTEKDSYWLEANLDSSKSAVKSFVKFANDKIDELFLQQRAQDHCLVLPEWAKRSSWMTFLLCVLIVVMNFMIFFGYEVDSQGDRFDEPKVFNLSPDLVLSIMYSLSIIIWIMFTYLTLIQLYIMINLQAMRAKAFYDNKNMWKGNKVEKVKMVFKYCLQNMEETLQARNSWCLVLWTIFAFLGIVIEFYLFAFTLIYLILFSPHMLEVSKAVWQPRNRILSTVILSFMILYWFALIAYVQFHHDFNTAVSESGNTLIGILVVIFDTWYKYDLGAFLMDNESSGISKDGKYDPRSGRIAFDFLFFFIVPVLLLSIVSGIIIDNFVERRSNSDSIDQRQNDQCFI